ncbi:MAG TPA: mechanosensitive ion channel domain-containing protein [Kofleriaceae bacterium]|nr:mechanosensitive ion channel domain-containing protein [Kofleriaceae bacterium]
MLETILQYLRTPLVVLSGTPVTTLTLLTAIFIVIVTKIIAALVGRSLDRVLETREVDRGLRFATGKITRYVIMVVGVFVAIGTLGIDTRAIMAGGAVLLVGIGFGLQKLAENFISGLLVLIERPVKKGDFIDAGGVLGVVEDIGLRATRVTSRDGVQVILPNSNLMSSTVINYSAPTHERRFQIDIGVAYGTDLDLAVKVIVEVANAEPKVLKAPAPEVRHMGFADSSIHLVLLVWIGEAREDLIVGSKLRFALDRAFRKHDIAIPFPQRDVHLIPPSAA